MWLLILLNVSKQLSINLGRTCLCTEIYVESDCSNFGCQFSSKLCLNLPCSDIDSRVQCDARMDCSFDHKAQKCSTFSQCNAYYVDYPEQCNNKGNQLLGCISNNVKTSDGYYRCTNYMAPQIAYVTCSTLLSSGACLGEQSDGSICFWKSSSNQCINFTLNSCSDASGLSEVLCDYSSCVWKETTCADKLCSDFSSQSACSQIPNLDGKQYTICSWNANTSKCENLNGVQTLTASSCTTGTLGTYFWNDVLKQCVACVGSNAIIALLNLILLIQF